MEVKVIEVSQGPAGPNWGKMMLLRFDVEWRLPSALPLETAPISPLSLLRLCGWSERHLGVWDLQTGEGALFLPGGDPHADLQKHALWVCPLFEPFLTWLYQQDLRELSALPSYVELPEAPFALRGARRPGPKGRR